MDPMGKVSCCVGKKMSAPICLGSCSGAHAPMPKAILLWWKDVFKCFFADLFKGI